MGIALRWAGEVCLNVTLSGQLLPPSSMVIVITSVRSLSTLPAQSACFVCSPGDCHAVSSLALAFQVDVLSGVGGTRLGGGWKTASNLVDNIQIICAGGGSLGIRTAGF